MHHPPHAQVDSAFFNGFTATKRFILIRHGQSEANARRVIQGLKDFRLDEAGRGQARELGAGLLTEGIGAIYASPLARAAETAAIVATALGLPPPVLREEFRELDTGSFSGLSLAEAKERFPEIYTDFAHRSWSAVPDAESAEALYERALAAWAFLKDRALEGPDCLACVSHGGFIQWLVRATFGTRSWMPLVPTANCGVFELRVEPSEGLDGRPGLPALHWERMNWRVPGAARPTPAVF